MEATHPEPDPRAALAERRLAFGRRLQDARAALGCSVQSLAQATRIGPHFIAALESGKLDELPGEVFGRGFVRNLGRMLGCDVNELVAEYDACWGAPGDVKSVLEVEIKNPPYGAVPLRKRARRAIYGVRIPRRVVASAAWVATIAVCIAGGVYVARLPVWQPLIERMTAKTPEAASSVAVAPAAPVSAEALVGGPDQDGAAAPAASAASAPAAPASDSASVAAATEPESAAAVATSGSAASAPAPAAPGAVSLVAGTGDQDLTIEALEAVRIRLDLDGSGQATRELVPGLHRFAFKTKADLMVYDAAAVKVRFNGRPLGSLGSKGRIRRLSFASGSPESKKL